MRKLWNGLFRNRKAVFPVVIAAGLCVAVGGAANAQQGDCEGAAPKGWTINNPSLDDQRDIADVLSGYAWTIDDWDVPSFLSLFVPDTPSSYELCNAGGQVFKLLRNGTGLQSMEDEMANILDQMKFYNWKTRHLVTNTLYHQVNENTVNTKSIVLVTLQGGNLDAPELDYSGEARATLVKDKDGNWKFQSLTVHADNSPVVAKKR